ncbi:MAG: hypothetical protein LBD55_00650 [Treponema sp.]|nr:hypothetical protein [Treponema sp.]
MMGLILDGYESSRHFGSLLEAEKNKLGIASMRTPASETFQRWMNMIRPDDTFDYNRALIQFVFSNPLVVSGNTQRRTGKAERGNCQRSYRIRNDPSGL